MRGTLFHGSPYEVTTIEPRLETAPNGETSHFVFAQARDIASPMPML